MAFEILDETPEAKPAGFEILPDEPETPGTLGGIVNSFRRGNLAGQRAIEALALSTDRGGPTVGQSRAAFERAMSDPRYLTELSLAGDDPAKLARVESLFGAGRRLEQIRTPIEEGRTALAQDIAAGTRKLEAIPQSEAMQAWAKADDTNWWRVFASNPVEITANIFAESLPQAAGGMAAGLVGGVAGGPVGAAAGAGTGSFAVEAANGLVQAAQEQGVDMTDPAQVRAFFADESKVKAARAFAAERGFPIAAFDALTAGVAGKFLKPALGKGVGRVALASGAEVGTQMAGGAAGETGAQFATGQPLSGKDIFAEAVGELVTAPGEVVSNLWGEARNRGFTVLAEQPESGVEGADETPSPTTPAGPVGTGRANAGAAADRGTGAGGAGERVAPAPAAAPADTSPEALSDLQATLRGNQLKPAERKKAEAQEDKAAREFIESRDKDYAGMSALELELLEGLGDLGARSERKARQVRKYLEQESGAKVGSGVANVGSERANVGSAGANVDFPDANVDVGARLVQASGYEIAEEEARATQPPPPVESYQQETSTGYTIKDLAGEAGGVGAPRLDDALNEMAAGRTASQVVNSWSGGRGEYDGLADILEQLRVAADKGRQNAEFRRLAEAYRRAFKEGGRASIDETLSAIEETERSGFTADGRRVRGGDDLIGRLWDHARGERLERALNREEMSLRFHDVAASNAGRSAAQNGGPGVDVNSLQQGDRFQLRGTGYEVERVEEDGTVQLRDTGEGRADPQQFGRNPVLDPQKAPRIYPDKGTFRPVQTSDVRGIDDVSAPGDAASRELPSTPQARALEALNRSLARAGAHLGQAVVVPRPEPAGASPGALREKGWRAFERTFRRRIVIVRSATGAELPFQGAVVPGHPGVIFLNERRANGEAVLGHEFAESLALENPELFDRLRAELRPLLRDFPDYQRRLNELERRHGVNESDARAAERELIGDFIGDLLARPEFLDALAARNPGLFKTLATRLAKFLRDVVERLRPYGANAFFKDVQAAEQRVMAALEEHAGGGRAEAESGGDTVFSMQREIPFTESKEMFRGTPAETTLETKRVQADNGELLGPALFSLQAYHGTPHEVDRFSTEKIGTGEGAQVYGWGLYFAENKKVAEEYARTLGSTRRADAKGDRGSVLPTWVAERIENTRGSVRHTMTLRDLRADFEERIQGTLDDKSLDPQLKAMRLQSQRETLAGIISASEGERFYLGNEYTVTLDVEPDELLDWDKPLSEQSEKVRGAVLRVASKLEGGGWHYYWPGLPFEKWTGSQIYEAFSQSGGPRVGAKELSNRLTIAGIPGIRYLDQGSRGTNYNVGKATDTEFVVWGNNRQEVSPRFSTREAALAWLDRHIDTLPKTYNYVIFDDSKITITHKNGQPVTIAEAAEQPRFSLSPEDRNARGAELVAERNRLRAAIQAAPEAERADLRDELAAVEAELDELIASAPRPRGGIPGRARPAPVPAPSATLPAASGPVSVSEAVADAARRVSSATQRQGKTLSEWWDGVKLFFRHLAVQVPEIPIFGKLLNDKPAQFAERFRRGIRLTVPATNAALDKAREAVENVVKPLMDLGRGTIDPNTVAKYNELGTKIEKERLRGPAARANRIDFWTAEQARLEAQLARNPWWLYQQAVLWRDLWWRAAHLKDRWGRPVKLPGNLTEEDALALAQLTDQRIEASGHADAIRESLRRHYRLMADLHQSLREHGEIIPENMQNPLYFPHQVLDYYTAKIDAVRPTTEEPFRSYLINPVGSEKLVMADYLASVYKHAAEIYAHNAQVDIAEKYVQSYDIGPQVQANLEAEAEARGEPRPEPDAYTWEKNIPNGYVAFKPYKLTPLRPELVIDRRKLSEALGVEIGQGDLGQMLRDAGIAARITPDMIIEAYVKGAREVTWLLPEEIADAVTAIQKRMDAARARTIGRLLGKPLEGLQRLWKYNVLFNPINWTRYERNNLTSDVLKMVASDPGMFRYLKRAAREIRIANTPNGQPTPELASAMKEGVLNTVTAGEAGDLAVLKDFEAFQPDNVRRREALRRLATAPTRGSAFREGVFRYAKFLADLERIRRGDKPEYGGAYAPDIEVLQSPVAKAAEISLKNFGDYSALSPAGKWLRRYLFPFFSWTEVNFRYHANLTRNLVDAVREGRAGRRDVARVAGAQATMAGVQALRIAVTLAAIRMAFEAWNQWGGQVFGLWDDDDEPEKKLSEADRRRLHVILGKDANGKIRVAQVADALGDVLQYFGGNNFARLGMEWARGQITLQQWATDAAKQMPLDTVNAFAQGLRPDAKAAYMMITGQSLFPDVTKQRNISRHDLTWNILSEMTDRSGVMGLRALLDKDHYAPQSLGEWMQQQVLGVRRRDSEQWGYFEIKDRAADWYEDRTGKASAGDWQSPDQVVLRNFRKAVYRGDVENAVRFYHRALDLGYTAERFRASLANQDPLAVIPDKANRAAFVAQLTPYERDLLTQAMRYYSRLAASRGAEAGLFPRAGRPGFPPQDARLQGLMERRQTMDETQVDAMTRQLIERSTRPVR